MVDLPGARASSHAPRPVAPRAATGVRPPAPRVHLGPGADRQRVAVPAQLAASAKCRLGGGQQAEADAGAGAGQVRLPASSGDRTARVSARSAQRCDSAVCPCTNRVENSASRRWPAPPAGRPSHRARRPAAARLGLRGGVALPGVDRRGHRLQDGQLALLALPARRLGQVQAAPPCSRFASSWANPGRGHLGGPLGRTGGPFRLAAAGVLLGELGRAIVSCRRAELQRLGEPPVQQPPLRRGHRSYVASRSRSWEKS